MRKTPPAKSSARKDLLGRTPVAEWVAAGLGLALTLGMLGLLVWEGLTAQPGPPDLSVRAEAVEATSGGFTLPVVVRNDSDETAADVEVVGTLSDGGKVVEERRATFTYVPGGGESRGGLVFREDPRGHAVELRAEGYQEP